MLLFARFRGLSLRRGSLETRGFRLPTIGPTGAAAPELYHGAAHSSLITIGTRLAVKEEAGTGIEALRHE